MRVRPLLVFAALLAGCGSGNNTTTKPGSPGTVPTCASFYPVDLFLNMNGSPTGTAVTPANLLAATDGPTSFGGWSSASSFQKFQPSFVKLPATVPINGGKTRTCGFATQSLGHDATGNFSTSEVNIPFKTGVVVGGWISNFPPNQDLDGSYFDVAVVDGIKGYAATMQIVTGTNEPACTSYGIEIESSGVATKHSACIGTVAPGGTYFVQMHVNFSKVGACSGSVVAPCAEMNVYSTAGTTFTQLGSTVSIALSGADSIYSVRLGNNEAGQFPGTISFQNWMMDYTNSKFPNLPH